MMIHYSDDPAETICGIPLFGSGEQPTDIIERVTCYTCRERMAGRERPLDPNRVDELSFSLGYDRGTAQAHQQVRNWNPTYHPNNHACDVCDTIRVVALSLARQAAFDAALVDIDGTDQDIAAAISDSVCLEGMPITQMVANGQYGSAVSLAARVAKQRRRLNAR